MWICLFLGTSCVPKYYINILCDHIILSLCICLISLRIMSSRIPMVSIYWNFYPSFRLVKYHIECIYHILFIYSLIEHLACFCLLAIVAQDAQLWIQICFLYLTSLNPSKCRSQFFSLDYSGSLSEWGAHHERGPSLCWESAGCLVQLTE